MTLPVRLSESTHSRQFLSINDWAMAPVLRAIGAKLIEITIRNMGASGPDRPEPWAPLSPKYAKRVKRSYATLYKEGALYRSFRMSTPSGNSITVSADSQYASTHQEGFKTIPRRAFFPITLSGNLTPTSERQLTTAANLAAQKVFRSVLR